MTDLNNRDVIKLLDKSNVLGSIEQLADQVQDAWDRTSSQNNQEYAKNVDHIVVSGMGGSNLGAEVIKALAKFDLKVPLEVVKDYQLPSYINERTLVILSSYSGTTEETLAAAKDAQSKNSKIAVITSGGDLAQLASDNHYPSYIIDPKYNPSGQPRMAIGYAIAGQIGLLKSFGLINADDYNITETISFLRSHNALLGPEAGDNLPKKLAGQVTEKIIYLISAGHLTGAAHVFNNQLNENAKHLTVEMQLPELNHHYMEALPHPESAKNHLMFWFFDSPLYQPKHSLRVKLTQDVVEQNHFPSEIISLSASTPFTQVFELIQLGAYTNFYLAMLHGIDPAPIPWVDYFKDKLKLHNS
jgi:glucose/mannose-6-phosphate isomerase